MKIIKIEKEPGFYFKVEDNKITLINNRAKKIKITNKLLNTYPEVEKVLNRFLKKNECVIYELV